MQRPISEISDFSAFLTLLDQQSSSSERLAIALQLPTKFHSTRSLSRMLEKIENDNDKQTLIQHSLREGAYSYPKEIFAMVPKEHLLAARLEYIKSGKFDVTDLAMMTEELVDPDEKLHFAREAFNQLPDRDKNSKSLYRFARFMERSPAQVPFVYERMHLITDDNLMDILFIMPKEAHAQIVANFSGKFTEWLSYKEALKKLPRDLWRNFLEKNFCSEYRFDSIIGRIFQDLDSNEQKIFLKKHPKLLKFDFNDIIKLCKKDNQVEIANGYFESEKIDANANLSSQLGDICKNMQPENAAIMLKNYISVPKTLYDFSDCLRYCAPESKMELVLLWLRTQTENITVNSLITLLGLLPECDKGKFLLALLRESRPTGLNKDIDWPLNTNDFISLLNLIPIAARSEPISAWLDLQKGKFVENYLSLVECASPETRSEVALRCLSNSKNDYVSLELLKLIPKMNRLAFSYELLAKLKFVIEDIMITDFLELMPNEHKLDFIMQLEKTEDGPFIDSYQANTITELLPVPDCLRYMLFRIQIDSEYFYEANIFHRLHLPLPPKVSESFILSDSQSLVAFKVDDYTFDPWRNLKSELRKYRPTNREQIQHENLIQHIKLLIKQNYVATNLNPQSSPPSVTRFTFFQKLSLSLHQDFIAMDSEKAFGELARFSAFVNAQREKCHQAGKTLESLITKFKSLILNKQTRIDSLRHLASIFNAANFDEPMPVFGNLLKELAAQNDIAKYQAVAQHIETVLTAQLDHDEDYWDAIKAAEERYPWDNQILFDYQSQRSMVNLF